MPFNSVTISLLSSAVRLGRDAGEVRQALFVPVVRFVIPCVAGITKIGKSRRSLFFQSKPLSLREANRTKDLPSSLQERHPSHSKVLVACARYRNSVIELFLFSQIC